MFIMKRYKDEMVLWQLEDGRVITWTCRWNSWATSETSSDHDSELVGRFLLGRNAVLQAIARGAVQHSRVPPLPRALTPPLQHIAAQIGEAMVMPELDPPPVAFPFMERVRRKPREDPTFRRAPTPEY